LLFIEISVYGMCPSSYEAVSRVKGSFDQFWNGMELLREREVPYVVKSALVPPIRSEIEELESWAAGLPWMDGPLGYTFFFDKRSRHDNLEKDRRIQTLRPSPKEILTVMARNPEKYRKDMAQFCLRFLGPPGDRLFSCGAGNTCCLDAYGRLQPCMALRLPDLTYDLLDGSLLKALQDFFPRLREIRAANKEYLERCARCFLSGLCEQCPGRSWSENGTLDTPVEYLCSITHYTARWLGLVGPKEHAWEVRDWQSRLDTS
jgi:radical SAM protein with 4Fe4S-binding SPASM domain